MNTGRGDAASAGTTTAALVAGGDTGSVSAVSEEFNGTSWTEGNDLITARKELGGLGIQTAALAIGGTAPPPVSAAVEYYDGTSWSTYINLNTARYALASAGTIDGDYGFAVAGDTGSVSNATEEFTGETTAADAADIDFD